MHAAPAIPDPVTRLATQAEAWSAVAGAAFDRAGVAAGWHCADLGCGPLGVLNLLADRVGRRGSVVGIEHEIPLLLAAMAFTAGRANVRVQPGDARATGLAPARLDLVHARFLCQETGVGPLLREIRRLLRPGGAVVLTEPDSDPWDIDPAPPHYLRLRRRVARAFLRRRSAVGSALAGRLRSAGFVAVRERREVLTFRGGHPYAETPGFALAATWPRLIRSGAATGRELEQLARDLADAAADPAVRHRSFPVRVVTARTPRR